MATTHTLRTHTFLPLPREEVFEFFAAAENLERITPPELSFRITDAPKDGIKKGARIRYRLGLFGVPFSWLTEITTWEPGRVFVDEQLSGPYALWHHTHTFSDVEGGTRMDDEVRWKAPLGPLGTMVEPIIKWQVGRIFAYRGKAMREILLGETLDEAR